VARPQFGKPQPRLISGRELCYVAIKPCGCVVVAIIPAFCSNRDIGHRLGPCLRRGWTIERMRMSEARDALTKCPHDRAARPPSGSLPKDAPMTMTAANAKLKLPTMLADLNLKFGKALNAPVLLIWPEGEKFMKAEQPEEIAKVLIRTELHERLVSAKIAYLFRPEIASRGEQKLTVSGKAGGQLAFLTGFDFTVQFNHKLWLRLTPEQRLVGATQKRRGTCG